MLIVIILVRRYLPKQPETAMGLHTINLIVVIRILDRIFVAATAPGLLVTPIWYTQCQILSLTDLYLGGMKLPPGILLGQTLYGMQNMIPQPKEASQPPLQDALLKIKNQEHPEAALLITAMTTIGHLMISSFINNTWKVARVGNRRCSLNPKPSFSIIMSPLTLTLSYSCIFGFQKRVLLCLSSDKKSGFRELFYR